MKIRAGFVSNSSSSSFVLIGKNLTGDSDIIQKLKFPDANIFGVWRSCGELNESWRVIAELIILYNLNVVSCGNCGKCEIEKVERSSK